MRSVEQGDLIKINRANVLFLCFPEGLVDMWLLQSSNNLTAGNTAQSKSTFLPRFSHIRGNIPVGVYVGDRESVSWQPRQDAG